MALTEWAGKGDTTPESSADDSKYAWSPSSSTPDTYGDSDAYTDESSDISQAGPSAVITISSSEDSDPISSSTKKDKKPVAGKGPKVKKLVARNRVFQVDRLLNKRHKRGPQPLFFSTEGYYTHN